MGTRLAGRTALVTGSTSGIGRGIAETFASEGAHVIVSGRRAALGHDVVSGIQARGGSAAFVSGDLHMGGEGIAAFVARAAAAAGGRIDILVNNAAHPLPATLTTDTTEDAVDAALAINVKAPFLLTAALVPNMVDNGGGVVINVGSINGTTGMAGAALFGATKAALHSLTKSWAAEFGRQGVRVNTVAPGPTAVEWNEASHGQLTAVTAAVPSGRLSQVGEIAAAALFLASDEASHIHGATIPVDGGMAAV